LLTHGKTVVIPGLKQNYGRVTDKAEMKIYFGNGSSISRANLDGAGVEVFFENADIWRVNFDWIARRLFWSTQTDGWIYVMSLHNKKKRTLKAESGVWNYDIAVDPTVG
jgi:hypothetical protein